MRATPIPARAVLGKRGTARRPATSVATPSPPRRSRGKKTGSTARSVSSSSGNSRIHLLSFVFIGGGFWLPSSAWKVLFAAQTDHTLAVTGPYAHIRHPQYAGFVLIMLGFLVQWPTILTLAMFPVLVFMYVRLARYEEREVAAEFGETYASYAARVPAFFPRPDVRHRDTTG